MDTNALNNDARDADPGRRGRRIHARPEQGTDPNVDPNAEVDPTAEVDPAVDPEAEVAPEAE